MKTYRPKTISIYIDGSGHKKYNGFADVLFFGKNKVVYADYSKKLSPKTTLTRKQFNEMVDAGFIVID